VESFPEPLTNVFRSSSNSQTAIDEPTQSVESDAEDNVTIEQSYTRLEKFPLTAFAEFAQVAKSNLHDWIDCLPDKYKGRFGNRGRGGKGMVTVSFDPMCMLLKSKNCPFPSEPVALHPHLPKAWQSGSKKSGQDSTKK